MAEVLTLLEWRLNRKEARTNAFDSILTEISELDDPGQGKLSYIQEDIQRELDKEAAADTFYSQPFTHSLIPMLFEGWKPRGTGYDHKSGAGIFINAGIMRLIRDEKPGNYKDMMPQNTLYGFINACDDAGLLPLMDWKPEVLEANPFLKID